MAFTFETLREELKQYNYVMRPGGFYNKHHDHMLDAMRYAMITWEERRKWWESLTWYEKLWHKFKNKLKKLCTGKT